MTEDKWARLQEDIDCGLRRGAWYRAVQLGAVEVTLDVNRNAQAFPRCQFEIRLGRPTRWTVVGRPRNAVRIPASWGTRYAVCPSCRTRQPPMGRPPSMRCDKCNGLFEVAWEESYLTLA